MGWVEQSGGHRGSERPYVEVRSTPRAQRARRRDKASWRFSGDQHPRYRPWHLGVPAALGKAPRDRKEEDMDLLCKRTHRPWKPHLRGSLKSWGSGGNSLFSPKRTSFSASLKKKKKKKVSPSLSPSATLSPLGWSLPPLALTRQLGPPVRRPGHDIFAPCVNTTYH